MSDQLAVWWEGMPPVAAEVDCGGERHVIRWECGRVTAEAHDLEAERTLAALGSSAPAPVCVDIVQAWYSALLMPELQVALGDYATTVPGSAEARRAEEQVVALRGRPSTLAASFQTLLQGATQLPTQMPDVVRGLFENTVTPAVRRMQGRFSESLQRKLLLARLEPAILHMPPELRSVLALQVAHEGRDTAAEPVSGEIGEAVERIVGVVVQLSSSLTSEGLIGDAVAHRVADVLVSSLARMWGIQSERARRLLAGSSPRVVLPLQTPQGTSVAAPGVSLTVHEADPSARPQASVRLENDAVCGDVTVPSWWVRRVYARGICRDQLVLEVLGESPDRRMLLVNAGRWETRGGLDVLETRRAELTSTAPGVWRTSRWLD